MRWNPTVRAAALGCASAAVLVACGETLTQVDESDVVSLRLSVDSAEVAIARDLQLRAYPLDATGSLLIVAGVAWSSSDAAIATVDQTGLVTGVAAGETNVVAQLGGYADTTVVTVDVLPALTLSADSIGFDVTAGGADPGPQSVDITNTGGLTLDGLAIDSTTYGAGANSWLASQLDSPVAPASLQLTAITAGITTAGVYTATVWLSATDATGSPAMVQATLDVAPGAPSSSAFQIVQGNNQTAVTETSVTTTPTVILRDQFDNPVPGATITFAASGGGTANPTSVMTDLNGEASTTWTVSTTGHVMAPNGTYPNTLTASATALTPLQFTGLAIYSFATHVDPIFPANCTGCHGAGVFTLSYGSLVGVASNCGGAAFPRVSTAGGDAGANASILLLYLTPGGSPPCGFNHIEFGSTSDPTLVILRSWIRNGAPNN